MDSNATRKPAAKQIYDEFIMPDLLARDHVSMPKYTMIIHCVLYTILSSEYIIQYTVYCVQYSAGVANLLC